MNPKAMLLNFSILLIALGSLFIMACGDGSSGEEPDLTTSPAISSAEAEGEHIGTDIVPFTEADYAVESCGEYGFGMHIEESDLPMVQCIIDKSRGKEGRAELLSGMMADAIFSSNQDAVRLLLNAGVDASGKSPIGGFFLLDALTNLTFTTLNGQAPEGANAAAIADSLVDEGARITGPPGEEYVNAWFNAAQSSMDGVRIMADAGMDVNIRPPLDKNFGLETALVGAVRRACWRDNLDPERPELEIVRVLVDAGADVNTMSIGQILDDDWSKVIGLFESKTVLSIAETSQSSCPQVVSILREAGACRDLEGRRVEWGSSLDFGGILKVLSAASTFAPRGDVECAVSDSSYDSTQGGPDMVRSTSLAYTAIFRRDTDLLKKAFAAGADVDAKDADGHLMLYWAILGGAPEVVQFLVDAGADVNATDDRGNSMLYWAILVENPEIVRILMEAGAK